MKLQVSARNPQNKHDLLTNKNKMSLWVIYVCMKNLYVLISPAYQSRAQLSPQQINMILQFPPENWRKF